MRLFDLRNFASCVQRLTQYKWLAYKHADSETIHPTVVADMEGLVAELALATKQLQLKASFNRASKELRFSLSAYGAPTWGALKNEFQVFWEILEPELAERRLVSIEIRKGEYINGVLPIPAKNPKGLDLVWTSIWKSFPSAKTECEEAIYCYALERNIASVFHSMRIAEIGLRALARRMDVKMPKNKKLEWAQWLEILKEMRGKADDVLATKKAGPAKDELLEFYNGAIAQFYGFKDEFRNQIMHVRKNYDEFDAEKALTRVRDFMEKLAKKINEKGRTIKQKKDYLAGI